MGQALAICGVDNIFADAPLSVAPVSLEAVIGAQPNVIVTVSQANQKDPWIEMWRTHLPTARLVEFAASDISQPVARILGGVSALCNALNHGVIERAFIIKEVFVSSGQSEEVTTSCKAISPSTRATLIRKKPVSG